MRDSNDFRIRKKKTELTHYQITLPMRDNAEGDFLNTFAETEALLKLAIALSQNSVKDIAVECGIKANTLYKWKTTNVHLSPQKADALLLYFIENEP